jgi:hypothetical protein
MKKKKKKKRAGIIYRVTAIVSTTAVLGLT